MKILHLADLHIGKIVSGFSMISDQRHVFLQIYDVIDSESIDAVCICGDIYDRSVPPAEAVSLFDEFLTNVSKRHVPVLIIPGNHDSVQRLTFGSALMENAGIYIAHHPQKVVLNDAFGKVNFYLLPFERPGAVRSDFDDESIRTYDDAVRRRIEAMAVDGRERNVLLAHHFVAGASLMPEISDSEMPISAGGIEKVSTDCFEIFDYTALGHIHKPQFMGSSKIRYAGSPLKYSFSEVNKDKSLTIVELMGKGQMTVAEMAVKPLHDMRRIKGNLSDLMNPDVYKMADTEDYLEVVLTDEKVLLEPVRTLKSVYPNIMQVSFERRMKKVSDAMTAAKHVAAKSPQELFYDFYSEVTGEMPDDERKTLIEEVVREAAEINS